MKNTFVAIILMFGFFNVQAQSCEDLMESVKSNYGTTYTSYDSEAISKVTFYSVISGYKTLYFAIVCFKQKYTYGCNEYIYQVESNTKLNYSIDHYNSAGKAFWKHIQPYADVLGCSPDFE
ncbi:hypothetical protein V5097_13355 [Arenibacter palladensis]|uniref:hypothetical protein n=1 Tax=Arenibacter palladensis TaxID=237373 RepID=UPI002FD22EA3